MSLIHRVGRALIVPLLSLPLWLVPGQALAAPATQAEMDLYTRIAAVNVCIARSAGIAFDKAVGIAGETIAQVIQGQHDGSIKQVSPEPLNLEDLRKGSINSAVLGASEVCPKEVPEEVLSSVEKALRQADTAEEISPAQDRGDQDSPDQPKSTKN